MTSTVYRPVKGKLRVRIPPVANYTPQDILGKMAGCRGIEWDSKRMVHLVSRARLHDVVATLRQFGDVRVVIDGVATQKCDTRCTQAQGDDCICSCAGANHKGVSGRNWLQVGDTALVSHDRTRSEYRVEGVFAWLAG